MLLTERERYNVLCVDEDFLKKFADMKDVYDEPDEKKDFNQYLLQSFRTQRPSLLETD